MRYSKAFTIPEEDRENYITEEEASRMIAGFNQHLRNYAIQVDELTKLNASLHQKFEKEYERNDNLRSSILNIKSKISNTESSINKKSQDLSLLEIRMDSEISKTFSNTINIFDLEKSLSENRIPDSPLSLFQNLFAYSQELESVLSMINTQTELLNKKIIEKNENLNHEVKCVKCKENYIPNQNTQTACAYHTGRLLYFSCKGCGGDPYYDCCMRCKTCSKGCRITNHTS